jgi:hypothetical protein
MAFNDLVPKYQNGKLIGWTCSRCGWSYQRDVFLTDVDAVARARIEFLGHTCGPSEGRTAANRWSYFLLSKVCGFESAGVFVIDPQTMTECGTEDEAENAFRSFSLVNFAEECGSKLGPGERLVSVSKVLSQCDSLGNTTEIMRADLKL